MAQLFEQLGCLTKFLQGKKRYKFKPHWETIFYFWSALFLALMKWPDLIMIKSKFEIKWNIKKGKIIISYDSYFLSLFKKNKKQTQFCFIVLH